jgi:hypothetical protein
MIGGGGSLASMPNYSAGGAGAGGIRLFVVVQQRFRHSFVCLFVVGFTCTVCGKQYNSQVDLKVHADKRGHKQAYVGGGGGYADQMADPYGWHVVWILLLLMLMYFNVFLRWRCWWSLSWR